MASYSVLPETLDVSFVRGDEFAILIDVEADLTGYSFEASAYQPNVPAGGGQITLPNVTDGLYVTSFNLTQVDITAGKINLHLTEQQTGLFSNNVEYRWYLRWQAPGVITRTAISGLLIAVDP